MSWVRLLSPPFALPSEPLRQPRCRPFPVSDTEGLGWWGLGLPPARPSLRQRRLTLPLALRRGDGKAEPEPHWRLGPVCPRSPASIGRRRRASLVPLAAARPLSLSGAVGLPVQVPLVWGGGRPSHPYSLGSKHRAGGVPGHLAVRYRTPRRGHVETEPPVRDFFPRIPTSRPLGSLAAVPWHLARQPLGGRRGL